MEQSYTQHVDSGYISVSENGRYFLDQNGRPFFWLGDTFWELFRCYTIEEAEAILENRRNNMIQPCVNYELIYRMVTEDYSLTPTKPTVMAEGGYEGFEFGRLQTPLEIRKQAYWSHLAGGHHSYGHNDNWVSPSSWKSWIDSPGSFQMGVYREVISSCREWWNWIPDQSVFASGEGSGLTLNATARSAWAAFIHGGYTVLARNEKCHIVARESNARSF